MSWKEPPAIPPEDREILEQTQALAREANREDGWSEDLSSRGWRGIEARLQRHRRVQPWIALAVASAFVCMAVLWTRPSETAARQELKAEASEIVLERGRVTVRRQGVERRTVVTPFVTVEVVSGQVAVESFESHALLYVSEGSVRAVRPGCEPVLLTAGTQYSSREPCPLLTQQSELYSQALRHRAAGRLEAALQSFHSYLVLYPTGPLAPEAALQEVDLLAELGRREEAAAALRTLRQANDGSPAMLHGLKRLETKLKTQGRPPAIQGQTPRPERGPTEE